MSELNSRWLVSHQTEHGQNLIAKFKSQIAVMKVLILCEIRLRSRRWSTFITLFLMTLLCWNMIADPASGMALLTINHRRTLYTSSALALGSASLLGALMLFAGFYLLRGRVAEDIRTGIAGVIATSPVSNGIFLASRGLAGLLYFMLLAYVGMLSIMLLQLVRGESGVDPLIYLQTYTLVFFPLACYVSSIAILFDSVPILMGKVGDFLFFLLWVLQLGLLAGLAVPSGLSNLTLLVFDFSGLMTVIMAIQAYVQTNSFVLGGGSFDPSLTPFVLPAQVWSANYVYLRLLASLVATLPLLLALKLFHRYSSDRVKPTQSRQRRTPLQILNQLSRPFAYLAKPVLALSTKLPPAVAAVVAELALSLIAAPVFIPVILLLNIAAAIVTLKVLPVVLMGMILCWGVLIADLSCRDFQVGIEQLTALVPGGSGRRYLRQHATSLLAALLFSAAAWPRLFIHDGFGLIVLLSGFVAVAILAHSAARFSKTPRLFLAVFLFWFYFAIQASKFASLDLFGFNHAADWASMLMLWQIAILAGLSGYFYNRYS